VSRDRAESSSCFQQSFTLYKADIRNCQYENAMGRNAVGSFPCRVPATSLKESIRVLVAAPYIFDIKGVIGEGFDCSEREKNFSRSFPERQGI
jgi:hypothetical protein